MPRKAREKHCEAIYHIMCRSISEFPLFRDDDDKNYYLQLLKKYTDKYKCSVYAYCIMDNHLHIHLDPKGYDISKFMHSTNTAYVRYFNIKYKRHGHVFQERFESRILDTDEYNLTVSAYIHNNPHDLEGYCGKEENYKYSSYGIYLGIRKDLYGLVDISFIMSLFNTASSEIFPEKYHSFVSLQRDVGSFKKLKKELSTVHENEYISGRSIILRDKNPSKILSYIYNKLTISDGSGIAVKAKKRLVEFRAFSAYVLRVLCGLGYRDICSSMHNVTISGCSRLCDQGYALLSRKASIYHTLFNELMS